MPTLNPHKLAEGINFRMWGDAVSGGRGGLLGRGAVDSSDSAPGPCVECPHVARCAAGLACAQFAMFIRFGGERWRPAPRVPSREIFAVLFPEAAAV